MGFCDGLLKVLIYMEWKQHGMHVPNTSLHRLQREFSFPHRFPSSPHPTETMSSTISNPTNPNLPSVQFPEIFEAALVEYKKKTEKDIKSDPLFIKLQDCKSSDAVLEVLGDQALAFEKYRKGDRKVQLMRRLKPTVEILCRLSTKDDSKESIVSVSLTKYKYSLRKFIIHPADISTSEGHIYWYWSPA
jgi:hypothetical protein